MRRYRLAPLAKADLGREYVARQAGMEVADHFVDSITDRFPLLAGRHKPDEIAMTLDRD